MKDYILQPKLPDYCLEEFLRSIKSIKIDCIIGGSNFEAFIDFIFLQKKFTVHWNVDQWIFYPIDDFIAVEFTHLIECVERQNNNKFNNFMIILKRKILLL